VEDEEKEWWMWKMRKRRDGCGREKKENGRRKKIY